MSTITTGRIITASISSIKKLTCDEIWQITRSDKVIVGTKWVPELAPGWDLFTNTCVTGKGKPPEEWWPLCTRTYCYRNVLISSQ
ncbi:MAG: hypothetical protein PHE82_05345 [Syntrophomonadaceae bacterium]|jgi:hypothetical protein|nr:hypothetical protein [Syntrophomonadaceae bacterium]